MCHIIIHIIIRLNTDNTLKQPYQVDNKELLKKKIPNSSHV